MTYIIERLHDLPLLYRETGDEAAAEIERLRDENQMAWNKLEFAEERERRLRALLGKLRWKSIDKDNMEFRCDTTCYVMDEIRRALELKP